MNQVEQWFSILQRKRLRATNFADLVDLEAPSRRSRSSRPRRRTSRRTPWRRSSLWVMTSANNSSTKKLYVVDARRKIDGKFYKCDVYVKTPEKAAEALAACKSLRK